LLGHQRVESTVHMEVDDVIEIAEKIDI
jgi:hypothetical protein